MVMSMKSKYCVAVLVLVGLASCGKEVVILPDEARLSSTVSKYAPITFTAGFDADTKTILNDDRSVCWVAGDRITVFDAVGNQEDFIVAETCSHFTFTTNGTIGEAPFYAVAGYGEDNPVFDKDAKTLSVAGPSTSTSGTFGKADVLAACSSSTQFSFRHIFAIVKVSIASEDVKALKFLAEGIASVGRTVIGFDDEEEPVIEYDKGGNSVKIEEISGPGTYYMAVNPGTYEGGFSFYLYEETRTLGVSSSAKFNAKVTNMTNFGTIDSTERSFYEVNAFLDENEWGVYHWTPCVGDELVPLYRYCEGVDQYSVNGSGKFRIQCLSNGQLVGITLSSTTLSTGDNCTAQTMLYGIEGFEDGVSTKTFTVKKVDGDKVWLLENGSDSAYIVSIN